MQKYIAKEGDIAGETPDSSGFRKVMIDGVSYRLHRVIWAWDNNVTTQSIRFKDNDRSNTRIDNLSIVTKEEILRSRLKFKNSSSDQKGVYYCKKRKKYIAQVKHQKKTHYVGAYEDEAVAHAEWLKRSKELLSQAGQEGEGEPTV